MSKSLRIALAIVEVTSIPLLVLTAIYILSGYQMLYPQIRLIPAARTLHTDKFLRILFVVLVYLHGLTGTIILCERRIRNALIRNIIEYIAIIGLSILLAIPLTLEFTIGQS
ncbi:MAG: hypothetical protein QXD38_08000 [Ignisphaera sp.]